MKKEFSYNKERMAKVLGRSMPISTKYSIEVCSFIRKKRLSKAKDILKEVIQLKKAVPIKKFKGNIPHKTKIGPGKYPLKVCKEVLSLLEAVEANAQFKGLNTADLIISKIVANKAATQRHHGRKRRIAMKRTNIDVFVEEARQDVKKKETTVKGKKTEEIKEEKKEVEEDKVKGVKGKETKVEDAKVKEAKVENAKGGKK